MVALPQFAVVKTVTCDQCGERFQITHPTASQDEQLAERQAAWLADRFVWDHIQETKHRASIDLPEILASKQA